MTIDEEYSDNQAAHHAASRTFSWIALCVALLFLLVSNGRHTITIAPWIALPCLLHFTRSHRARVGMPLTWLTLSLAWAFQFRGMAPVPGIFYFLLSAVYGFTLFMPFALDRLLRPRIHGFTSTMIFPCAWVTMEWLVASFTPYGSWGSIAYTQHEFLALLQMVAITGLYGPSFLIAWFASVVCWMSECGLDDRSARRGGLIFLSVLIGILIGGGVRLVFFAPNAPTVRIASLTKPDLDLFEGVNGGVTAAFTGQVSEPDVQRIRDNAESILGDLFLRADVEARAGARIIFWGETNSFSLKEDEVTMMTRGATFAREHDVFLGMAAAVFGGNEDRPLENKMILFDPEGNVVFEYWKAIPVPGSEASVQALNDRHIRFADTPYGRIGAAICFDMDFPVYLRQAGRGHADIMLVPSNDWREIDPWHSHMARFRAIEEGFNLVRHTSKGLSLACDYQGRVLASMDHFACDSRDLVAMVPTRGVHTVYSRIGDLFAWMCIAGLALAAGLTTRLMKATPARSTERT